MPVIILTTVLTLSALYAPQPLLPVIMQQFGVSRQAAAFLTTITFVPLSVAPLFYGYLLELLSPRRMLRVAVLLLAASEVLFFLGGSFSVLVAVRLLQGLLVPAILTALMTYVSVVTVASEVPRAMAVYIASTILGGFLGRAFSGLIATLWGWRYSFLVLAASLLVSFVLLGTLRAETRLRLVRPRPQLILEVLKQRVYLRIYLVVFCLFLVFAAVMNFLPFRLTELSAQANELRIGLMYSGYTMGIVTSLSAVRISRWLGGPCRAILAGLALYLVALAGLDAGHPEALFAVMFLFCAAMFLVHATASGFVNALAGPNKGMVNGLYVAFYYAGGTIGSFVPGIAYRQWGWGVFLAVLAVVAATGLALAVGCRHSQPVAPKSS